MDNFGTRHCPTKCALYRKQTTEPKWLISYTDTSYCIHILGEVCRSVFFMDHTVYDIVQTANENNVQPCEKS